MATRSTYLPCWGRIPPGVVGSRGDGIDKKLEDRSHLWIDEIAREAVMREDVFDDGHQRIVVLPKIGLPHLRVDICHEIQHGEVRVSRAWSRRKRHLCSCGGQLIPFRRPLRFPLDRFLRFWSDGLPPRSSLGLRKDCAVFRQGTSVQSFVFVVSVGLIGGGRPWEEE